MLLASSLNCFHCKNRSQGIEVNQGSPWKEAGAEEETLLFGSAPPPCGHKARWPVTTRLLLKGSKGLQRSKEGGDDACGKGCF